jgi:hypothetical protein
MSLDRIKPTSIALPDRPYDWGRRAGARGLEQGHAVTLGQWRGRRQAGYAVADDSNAQHSAGTAFFVLVIRPSTYLSTTRDFRPRRKMRSFYVAPRGIDHRGE